MICLPLLLQQVFVRHALHKIVGIVYYRDNYNNEMVAVKIGRPEPNKYDVYIYQCEDEVTGTIVTYHLGLSHVYFYHCGLVVFSDHRKPQ